MPVGGSGPSANPLELLVHLGLAQRGEAHVVASNLQRHDSYLVATGADHVFVKVCGRPLVAGEVSLVSEVRFFELLAANRLPEMIKEHVPVPLRLLPDAIVVEGLPGCRDLRSAILAGESGLESAGAATGRFLAALHGAPPGLAESLDISVCPVQTYGTVTPEMLGHSSSAFVEFLSLVQPDAELSGALAMLRTSWRPRCLVHGDMKVDNVLLSDVSAHPRPVIVDWELAAWGEPLWDCGSFVGSVCWSGLESMHPGDSIAALTAARLQLQDIVTAFLDAYRRSADGFGAEEERLVHAWAGYWLIQRVAISLPARRELTAGDVAALHLAREMMVDAGHSQPAEARESDPRAAAVGR